MIDAPGVDIITRLYDLTDLPRFDRMLFSVMGQRDAAPLRVHVMLQRFAMAETQAVRAATSDLRRLNDGVSVVLHNWDFPAPFDLRVPLLNWGLDVAVGRRVMCLGVDEQLHAPACAVLSARLRGGAALALAGVVRQPVRWWGEVVLPLPAGSATPAPAKLFLMDRGRLAATDCVFQTGEPDAELDEFVGRIGRHYEVDRACQHIALATRQDVQDSPA